MKYWKRSGCILLSLIMAVSLWGCATSGAPDGTTSAGNTTQVPETTTPTQTTIDVPETTTDGANETTAPTVFVPIVTNPQTVAGTAVTTQQQRVHRSAGWASMFNSDGGCFLVVDSVDALLEGLSQRGGMDKSLDLEKYDEAFFQENRLVLIPASSNSGSVRYTAKVTVEGETLHIEFEVQMPQIGTADMAEWLILVELPLAEYDASLTITVPNMSSSSDLPTA